MSDNDDNDDDDDDLRLVLLQQPGADCCKADCPGWGLAASSLVARVVGCIENDSLEIPRYLGASQTAFLIYRKKGPSLFGGRSEDYPVAAHVVIGGSLMSGSENIRFGTIAQRAETKSLSKTDSNPKPMLPVAKPCTAFRYSVPQSLSLDL